MPRKLPPPGEAEAVQPSDQDVATEFLVAMFGELERGHIVLSVIDDSGNWRDSVATAKLDEPNSIIDLAGTAIRMSTDDSSDVYFATMTMAEPKRHGNNVSATPALFADFDFAGSSQTKPYEPWSGPAEVEAFLADRVPVKPSIIVSSGHGWHVYWMFDEALTWWGDEEEAANESLLTRWEQWLHSEAKDAGHGLDAVVDLGRVLRVPGTVNRKHEETKPVELVLLDATRRYSPQDIDDLIPGRFAGRALRGHVDSKFRTDSEIISYIESFGDENTPDGEAHTEAAMNVMGKVADGRHFALLSGLGALLQDQWRGRVNMGAALANMEVEFEKLKPAGEQTHDEFAKAVRDVAKRRMAEADRRYGGGDRIADALTTDETLPDVQDSSDSRAARTDTRMSDVRFVGDDADAEVEKLVHQYKINRTARDMAQHELAEEQFDRDWDKPKMLDFQTFLMRQYDPVEFRVDGLWTTESKVILSAEAKSGKTTLVLNLLDAMLDGGKFLDRFSVKKPDGKIVFVNFEVSERQMHEWLGRGRARNLSDAFIVNEIGRASMWDVRLGRNREALARMFESVGATVLVIDTLGMILDALGVEENSNSEVGEVLSGFDALLAESTISELLIVHHFGHSGDRSRGASKLLGWPDALWTYHIEGDIDDDEIHSQPRFLSVKGRDVSLPKLEVMFDQDTSAVSMKHDASGPTRVIAKRKGDRDIDAVVGAVRDIMKNDTGDLYTNGVSRNLIEGAAGINRSSVTKVLEEAVKRGVLIEHAGARGARLFQPGVEKQPLSAVIPLQSVSESPTSLHLPSPPFKDSREVGREADDHLPSTPYGGKGGRREESRQEGPPPFNESTLKQGRSKSKTEEALADALGEASAQAQAEMPIGDVTPGPPACRKCEGPVITVGGQATCAGGCE